VTPHLRDVLRRLLIALGFAVAFAMVTLFIYPRYGLAFSLLIMLLLAVMLVRAYAMGYRYRCGAGLSQCLGTPVPQDHRQLRSDHHQLHHLRLLLD